MNCLYYCDWFEQYTADLALAVAAESHRVTVIVREQAPEFTGQGRPADGVEVRRRLRAGVDHLHTLSGRHRSAQSLFKIHRVVRQCRPDVFHLQQTSDPRFLWVALRTPTALTLHEPFVRPGNHRTRTLLQTASTAVQWLYRRFCDLIIVHTETGLNGLSPTERRKAVVVPHGVSAAVLPPSFDSTTILFFGRVDGYKGLDVLLSAMTAVWNEQPDAHLRILASGGRPDYPITDPRITATWEGYSDDELRSALTEARAVCLPYTTVSGSGAGAQAYGSGKPIVASDLEGLRELTRHEELLAEPGDPADLARGLLQALTHDYGVQPIDPARTWPHVAHAHLRAYARMLGDRRRIE